MADIEIPEDWDKAHWKTQVALAEKLSGQTGLGFKEAYPIIKAEVDRRNPPEPHPTPPDPEPEEFAIEPPATQAAIKAVAATKMVTIKLEKNYRPMEFPQPVGDPKPNFEIVGYNKPALIAKDVAGRPIVLDKAEFIPGVAMPPAQAGTGFADKLLAGTVAKFSTEEARHIRANGIGTVEIDLD